MADGETLQIFTRQSRFSDPGRFGTELERLPADVAGLRQVSSGLVFHHCEGGDWAANGIAADRIREVDTRYADLMLERLLALRPGLCGERSNAERIVGCCRDSALLFVTMARHHGLPARLRVGFAGYFAAGWWIYHMIAEVWDAAGDRWRLVEPGAGAGHVDPTDGEALDVLDVGRNRFLPGPDAWRRCRSGAADPDRFVIDPRLDEPMLRSWPMLSHNLCLDLAALNRVELLLWDLYGYPRDLPEAGGGLPPLRAEESALLDAVAASTSLPDAAPAELGSWLDRDALRIPQAVTTFSPARDRPAVVTLRP